MSYTFDTVPIPVLLDSVYIKHNVVLLLNTFFHIIIYSYVLYLRHSSYTGPSRQCIHQARRCPPRHVFLHTHLLLYLIPSTLFLYRSFSTVYPSSTTLSSSSTHFSTYSSTLISYTFDTPPIPVLLDSVFIKHNVVLLLNTFFHILIYSYVLYLRHSSYTGPSRQCIHPA